ncbi:hypothetical protein HQ563_13570 [bacterium]|nr:hypothetical protein [bacterium]
MDVDGQRENEPYDETVEAAKMLEDIAQSSRKQSASPEKKAHTLESRPDREVKPHLRGGSKHPSLVGKEEPGEPSIGELFSGVVKMSPQEKVRIEEGSIGSLFKKYIEKRA